MKKFRFLAVWLCVFAGFSSFSRPAMSDEEIASVAASRSNLTGIALSGARRVTDAAFNASLSAQVQGSVDEFSKSLGWKNTLVLPETLAFEVPRAKIAPILASVNANLARAGWKTEITDLGENEGAKLKWIIAQREGFAGHRQGVMGLWILSDEGAVLSWAYVAPTPPASGEVLAQTTPKLTQSFAREYGDFLAWLLKLPNAAQKRDETTQLGTLLLADAFDKNRADEIAAILAMLHGFRNRAKQNAANLETSRLALLYVLRNEYYGEKTPSLAAQTFIKTLESLEKPLARAKPGAPPLSPADARAWAQFQAFALRQIPAKITLSPAEIEAMQQLTVQQFPALDAESQKQLAGAAVTFRIVSSSWPKIAPKQRAATVAGWNKSFAPIANAIQKGRRLAAQKQAKEKAEKARLAKAQTAKSGSNASSSSKSSYSSSLSSRLSAISAMNSAYASMSNSLWTNHYRMSNTIANFGNSPYRYVNAWGNPY